MFKLIFIFLLVALSSSRTYPMFKQCDSRWGNDRLGTSQKTICQAGCLMSSVAMALAATKDHNQTPKTLNQWLIHNGGYVSGDAFVWASVNKKGITYKGKVSNSQIKSHLDKNDIVLCNVHNGGHWVLAHSYKGDQIYVNDPGFSTSSYTLSQIVDGQNGIYTVG